MEEVPTWSKFEYEASSGEETAEVATVRVERRVGLSPTGDPVDVGGREDKAVRKVAGLEALVAVWPSSPTGSITFDALDVGRASLDVGVDAREGAVVTVESDQAERRTSLASSYGMQSRDKDETQHGSKAQADARSIAKWRVERTERSKDSYFRQTGRS